MPKANNNLISCPKCKKRIHPRADFCNYCGIAVSSVAKNNAKPVPKKLYADPPVKDGDNYNIKVRVYNQFGKGIDVVVDLNGLAQPYNATTDKDGIGTITVPIPNKKTRCRLDVVGHEVEMGDIQIILRPIKTPIKTSGGFWPNYLGTSKKFLFGDLFLIIFLLSLVSLVIIGHSFYNTANYPGSLLTLHFWTIAVLAFLCFSRVIILTLAKFSMPLKTVTFLEKVIAGIVSVLGSIGNRVRIDNNYQWLLLIFLTIYCFTCALLVGFGDPLGKPITDKVGSKVKDVVYAKDQQQKSLRSFFSWDVYKGKKKHQDFQPTITKDPPKEWSYWKIFPWLVVVSCFFTIYAFIDEIFAFLTFLLDLWRERGDKAGAKAMAPAQQTPGGKAPAQKASVSSGPPDVLSWVNLGTNLFQEFRRRAGKIR